MKRDQRTLGFNMKLPQSNLSHKAVLDALGDVHHQLPGLNRLPSQGPSKPTLKLKLSPKLNPAHKSKQTTKSKLTVKLKLVGKLKLTL